MKTSWVNYLGLAGIALCGISSLAIVYQFLPLLNVHHTTRPLSSIIRNDLILPVHSSVTAGVLMPSSIQIFSINLQDDVVPSSFHDGAWDIHGQVVNLAVSNELGITGDMLTTTRALILFAHRADVFFFLPSVKDGDTIILDAGKMEKKYVVVRTTYVGADDSSILLTSFPGELILYTCDLFTDSQRFVVLAKDTSL